MGKSLIKDLIREIKKTFGRFFAIFAIVAIGVAFFAGVTAASSDMRNSADAYYDQYNLMDERIVSSIGFNENDITAIKNVDGINGVYPSHSMDALIELNTSKSAVKVMSIPLGKLDPTNENYINQLRLKEGRLPENSGECVVKYEAIQGDSIKIGENISLQTGTDANISATLRTSELQVVGIVYTPYYLSYEMGSTTIGNGKINHCIFIPDSDFVSEYYTEVFATVSGAKEINSYKDSYFDLINPVTNKLETLSQTRIQDRIQTIKDKVKNEVTSQLQLNMPGNVPESILNQQIESAQEKALEQSSDWKWFVLDRNSHYSYRDYGQCADRMDSIATIFPIFFLLVSALVCLTTMTRMVEEQRGFIGTMKALGYQKTTIAFKYISYAFIASILGGIAGCIIGLNVFPRVIYSCWNIMYELPPIQMTSHIQLILLSIGSMTVITTLAALFACYKELMEQPSMLMRPKVPQRGKKILLERIGPLWRHLKFTQKVTVRNIFRYKKRFIMTLVGISGCTALLLAGFAIKDSIAGLIDNQFKQVFKYQFMINYNDQITEIENSMIISDIQNNPNISDYINVYSSETNVNSVEKSDDKHNDISVNLIAIDNEKYKDKIQDFITFRSRVTHKGYELNNNGVIISEKLANDLKLKAGDSIYIADSSGAKKKAIVSAITEMYVNHYVFISDQYYKDIFGSTIRNNEILGRLSSVSTEVEDQVGNHYLNADGIQSITFFSRNIDKFNKMINSLDLVTYVLIISAALLEFIVLYNLTNINISERMREIATIKVLGFYDPEVAAYVYRENIVITIIGSFFGLGLGVILHAFIMKTVEMDALMYGYAIHLLSFVLAFLFTLGFSLVVNLVMYKKLSNIQMVESLKSVE